MTLTGNYENYCNRRGKHRNTCGGWVPDFDSRYFVADFSYGLKVIKEIAAVFGMPTPNIDMVWNWYKSCDPNNGVSSFELGITKEDFLNLYI